MAQGQRPKNTIEIVNAASTTSRTSAERHSARQVQRHHRRVWLGQVHTGVRHLFNEGQRRYLESLNAYARSIVQPAGRPEVDAVYGIPPTVAIEQRPSRGGRKSTVGTTTEFGTSCACSTSSCSTACIARRRGRAAQTMDSIVAQLLTAYRGQQSWAAGAAGGEPQGRLHRAGRQVARPGGFTHLRVDGEFLPTTGFPAP